MTTREREKGPMTLSEMDDASSVSWATSKVSFQFFLMLIKFILGVLYHGEPNDNTTTGKGTTIWNANHRHNHQDQNRTGLKMQTRLELRIFSFFFYYWH
jgi:hypothetical protein